MAEPPSSLGGTKPHERRAVALRAGMSSLESLPLELQAEVCALLDDKSLCKLAGASRTTNTTVHLQWESRFATSIGDAASLRAADVSLGDTFVSSCTGERLLQRLGKLGTRKSLCLWVKVLCAMCNDGSYISGRPRLFGAELYGEIARKHGWRKLYETVHRRTCADCGVATALVHVQTCKRVCQGCFASNGPKRLSSDPAENGLEALGVWFDCAQVPGHRKPLRGCVTSEHATHRATSQKVRKDDVDDIKLDALSLSDCEPKRFKHRRMHSPSCSNGMRARAHLATSPVVPLCRALAVGGKMLAAQNAPALILWGPQAHVDEWEAGCSAPSC